MTEGIVGHNSQTSQALGSQETVQVSMLWCVLSPLWLLHIQFRADWELCKPNLREEND